MTANTQHFCHSYEENNQKMIVYNDADLNSLFLMIGKKYWEIRIAENGTELEFTTEDKVSIVSRDLQSDEYTFAFKYIQRKNLNIVGFYKVLNVFFDGFYKT